jgi:hypothetical protein
MMSKKTNELQEKLRLLQKQFPNRDKFVAAHVFLDVHLQLARAAKRSAPALAIEQYKLAESCQCCIGTYATGSGEGLASMAALYDIMAERAELEEQLAHSRKRIKDKVLHLQEALGIWRAIQADPNLDELLPQKDIEPMEMQLAAWKMAR